MFDLFELDREVRELAVAERQARRTPVVVDGAWDNAPLFPRKLSSLETAKELDRLAADPLARGVRDWVAMFAVERVTKGDREDVLVAFAATDPTLAGEEGFASARLVRDVLAEGKTRELALRALRTRGRQVGDTSARWIERRQEALRRAHVAVPSLPDRLVAFSKETELAEQLLDRLRTLGRSPRTFADDVRVALAREAGEGWPAHLTPRGVAELLGPLMFEGVAVGRPRLPPPLGASSFAMAFANVGEDLAFRDWDRATPFTLARAPGDPLVYRRAALFGLLVLEPAFHQKRLGMSRQAAREQVQKLGHAFTAWLAQAAFRLLLLPLATASGRHGAFEELSERIYGRPMPGAAFTTLPRLDPEAAGRLTGLLVATTDRAMLRDRFDEDWFDNPKAVLELRHENHQATLVRNERPASPTDVEATLARLRETLDG